MKMTWLDFGFGPIIFGALVALHSVILAKFKAEKVITAELIHISQQNFNEV